MKFDFKTATQLANFFAFKEGWKIGKLKLMKLAWLADRYHLRNYGRSILGDNYVAMRYWPVPSSLKDVVDGNVNLVKADLAYVNSFIRLEDSRNIVSIAPVDYKRFSDTDVEAMEAVYDHFWMESWNKLVTLSHFFPEWAEKEQLLEERGGRSCVPMDYLDFFKNTTEASSFFQEDAELLTLSQEVFIEDSDIRNLQASL